MHFLLWTSHCIWIPAQLALKDILMNSVDGNEMFLGSIRGYLIKQGLAFRCCLDLLEVACKEEWKCWRDLWGWL